ncbi:hypothetical protein CASFOL_013587 [Castilleja foliolosa]|uniref:F-box domain-containing protein n=1 Tax=Castilleja foliolosa TaxID=1961234 RepID=A0ABD3DM84_9LAMI
MEQIAGKRARVVVEKNNNDDLISSLPVDILHKIMSLLLPRHATATSILSRRWETIWLSFPSINLDESDFNNRQIFCSCLRSTLSRHNLSYLQTLKLHMTLPGCPQLNRCVCELMKAVLRDGKILKELDIIFRNPGLFVSQDFDVPSERVCALPKETFSASAHLVFLRVEGCRFEGCPTVYLPKLKTLHMKNIFIQEVFLMKLIHTCPIIDTLSIEYCFGIENVRICHPALQELVFGFRNDLETLELDVPSVKCINFHAFSDLVTEEGLLKVLGYQNSRRIQARNLQKLHLEDLSMIPDVFHNLISIFPKMEELDMTYCDVLGQVQLHSKSLTNLVMTECILYGDVDIRAQNLRYVGYIHDPEGVQLNYTSFKHVRSLSLVSVEDMTISIKCSIFSALDSLELDSCNSMKQLNIASNKLESLDVSGCDDLKNCTIIAPKLSTFLYSGQVVRMNSLVSSKKLRVRLHLKGPDEDHDHAEFVKSFLGFLQKVDASAASMAIHLDFSCTECLMMIKDIHFPPTSLVQYLKFEPSTEFGGMGLRDLLSYLLSISIYCNKLSIDLGWFSLTLQVSNIFDRLFAHHCALLTFEEIKEKKECVGKTKLARIEDNLVRVEIQIFTGSDEQVDLVELFVGKARHMQHMTISMKKGEDDATQRCLDAFHRKLHLFRCFDIVSHGGCVSFSRNAI